MSFIMILYAVVLVALAAYLLAHRTHDFLSRKDVPAALGKTLGTYALVLILAAAVAVLSAFVTVTWLQLCALILGAGTVGVLGIRLPSYIGE